MTDPMHDSYVTTSAALTELLAADAAKFEQIKQLRADVALLVEELRAERAKTASLEVTVTTLRRLLLADQPLGEYPEIPQSAAAQSPVSRAASTPEPESQPAPGPGVPFTRSGGE